MILFDLALGIEHHISEAKTFELVVSDLVKPGSLHVFLKVRCGTYSQSVKVLAQIELVSSFFLEKCRFVVISGKKQVFFPC